MSSLGKMRSSQSSGDSAERVPLQKIQLADLNFDIEAEILKKGEKMKTIEAPRADTKKFDIMQKYSF
jgi:hypothetical protein